MPPSPPPLRWTDAAQRRFIVVAAAVSLLAHGVALALHFTLPAPTRPPTRDIGLEIILVNAGTRAAPQQADVLAQVASDGGGHHEQGRARAPVPRSAASQDGELLESLRQRQQALEAEQRLLAAQAGRNHDARLAPPTTRDGPSPSPADTERSRQLTRQFAEIANRIEDYNKRPRKHFFAPSTSEYRFATYVEQWRRRIEEVGNRNYPPEARGKIYGSLRMTVYIRADGSLDGVDIDRPADHKMLNDAARRIVALAAPFAPFPPQIARDTDILAITRTWHFTNNTLTATPG